MTTEEKNRLALKIINEMYEEIAGYVLRYCINEELAKDILQETFLEVCRHIEELSVHESYRGWVYKTAQNKLKKMLKKQSDMEKCQVPVDESVVYGIGYEDEYDFLTFEEYRGILNEKQIGLLLNCYQNQYTIPEIARKEGKSEGAVKMRLKRTKDKIRQHMGWENEEGHGRKKK